MILLSRPGTPASFSYSSFVQPIRRAWRIAAVLACIAAPSSRLVALDYVHFEARQSHPLDRIGSTLLAVNSTAGTLTAYDLAALPPGGNPPVIAEVSVGVEPVTVRARTATEAWVVNEVSDSISIVDLEEKLVVATLQVPDEPADVVFAGGRAFVACARSNSVRVFDTATRAQLATIPLLGLYPTSLAVSPGGQRVYASFLLSGNQTTILPASHSPEQPLPTNPSLPRPPDTGSIVPVTHPKVDYKVYDHDVTVIDVDSMRVTRYLPAAGTTLFAVATNPTTGDVFVANSDARNLVRFEPALRGHAVDHRVTRYRADGFAKDVFDLNAEIDPTVLPNPEGVATALAQPHALEFDASGGLWVAAFNSDRLARLDPETGAITQRIDLRPDATSSRFMRGPRGLAYDADRATLYVLNKLSNTIMAVSPASGTVIAEFAIGSGEPMPTVIREGRGFLFDARRSGNGMVSCASCHVDADRDGLAWDLGNPAGEMTSATGYNFAVHDTEPLVRPMHPMKGPLLTQTLRGVKDGAPFHWRGDKPTLQSFNATFVTLLGGELLPAEDIAALETYLLSLRHHPNPNRKIDDSFADILVGGKPKLGRLKFGVHENHCNVCHSGPRGSSNNIDDLRLTDSRDQVKDPPLQTLYQRVGFDRNPGGVNISGYGLNRNGAGSMLPTPHFYELSALREQDLKDVTAYLLSFDSGTPAATGQSRTLSAAGRNDAGLRSELTTLEAQQAAGKVDLVISGSWGGQSMHALYDAALPGYRRADGTILAANLSALLAGLTSTDELTFTAVPPGQGAARLTTP